MSRDKVNLSVKPISRLIYKGQTNYAAHDANEEPDIDDEGHASQMHGLGETREEAEADFWEQWEERELEREEHRMRQLDAQAEKGIEQ